MYINEKASLGKVAYNDKSPSSKLPGLLLYKKRR